MTPAAPSVLDPRLVRGLQELFGLLPHELRPDAELEGDLQLDSLAIAELQVWLEDVVGARIAQPGAAAPPRTVAELQTLLAAALQASPGTGTSPVANR